MVELRTFPITLVEAYMITPSVKHFVFQTDLSPAFNFIPGQFITIHFEVDGKTFRRSYSIANKPKQDNRIEFAAGFVEGGPGTQLLFHLSPGDTVRINGPFGRLILKDPLPKRYILVATSTGITPYRAMLDELSQKLAQDPSLTVVILQGVQRRNDLLYAEEFLEFVQKHPQATFKAHYSREENNFLLPHETMGYVQKAFTSLNLDPEQDMIYLCGNPGMIDEAFNDLKERGFTTQHIIREKYISS